MENLQELKEQFCKVLEYSQFDYKPDFDLNVDTIFDQWLQNKRWFIDKCPDLIYEHSVPITFEMDDEDRKLRKEQFLHWVKTLTDNDALVDFLDSDKVDLFHNYLSQDFLGYQAGTRVSKILLKLFEYDPEIEAVRQELSRIIQENRVNGVLCFSVHPLDYLSASENCHSWRSCHALDGEYRVGNISYMEDACTIMVYLKSDNDVHLPHFPRSVPWNNKKWRCYLYVDRANSLIYAGKQYPFSSNTAYVHMEDIIYDYFDYFYTDKDKENLIYQSYYYSRESIKWNDFKRMALDKHHFMPAGMKGIVNINGMDWEFENTKLIVGYGSNRKIVPVTNYIVNDPEACCFNDVIQSHTYAPYVLSYQLHETYIPERVHDKLIVGKGVKCICCGKNNVADSDTFFCMRCNNAEVQCQRCGAVGNISDGYELVNGDWICYDCLQER